MSRLSDARAGVETADVVDLTCAAYDQGAAAYAEATKDFADYPGLREALINFAKALPAHLPTLDVGCGGGRDARLLAGRGRRVVAGDISAAMLKCARSLSAARPYRDITYVRVDMLELPFKEAQFGGVWASASVLHLPSRDIPRALSEIWRTLAPGGMVALSMRAGQGEGWRDGGTLPGRRWFTFVDPRDFAAELAQAGFADVEVQFVGRRDWFIAQGRKR